MKVGYLLPTFKMDYKTVLTQSAQYWHKNRHIDELIRIEGPQNKFTDF
jgi:hypothetical protein